jgi:hypothetical protein
MLFFVQLCDFVPLWQDTSASHQYAMTPLPLDLAYSILIGASIRAYAEMNSA